MRFKNELEETSCVVRRRNADLRCQLTRGVIDYGHGESLAKAAHWLPGTETPTFCALRADSLAIPYLSGILSRCPETGPLNYLSSNFRVV